MIENVVIEPMTEAFLLWRCLHSGPVSRSTIDTFPADNPQAWDRYRARNLPLLATLTRIYGACAIVARAGDEVVGQLRFYPKVVAEMEGAGGLCLQQDYPSGPADDFAAAGFPPPARIKDKTLAVHCLMTGSPKGEANPYQRKGIGTRMAKALIEWAAAHGWERIEALAFEDLPIVYAITGSTGHRFWEKLGFSLAERSPHPYLQEENEFTAALDAQARKAGIPPRSARDQFVMRLDVSSRRRSA